MTHYRQGDLLIVRNESGAAMRGEWHPIVSGIVELGEATGHAHRLEGGTVLEAGMVKRLVSDGTARLVHDEHATITLPEGDYTVVRQREYMGDGEWANVYD